VRSKDEVTKGECKVEGRKEEKAAKIDNKKL
jgi:hypothetical protein